MRGVSGEAEKVIPPRHYAGQVSMKTGSFRKDRPVRVTVTISARRTSAGRFIGLPQVGIEDCPSASYTAYDGRATLAAFWGSSAETWRVKFCSLSATNTQMRPLDWVPVSRGPGLRKLTTSLIVGHLTT